MSAATTTAVSPSRKTAVFLGVLAIASVLLFVVGRRAGVTTFRIASPSDFVQIAPIAVPAVGAGLVTTLVTLAAAVWGLLTVRRGARVPRWLPAVSGGVFVLGFLAWAAVDGTVALTGLLVSAVGLSVPLVFGALGGVVSERVGVINVAIEGQLLAGAFTSAVVASVAGSPLAGLVGAVLAGVLVSLLLALFAIRFRVDQVIVGIVLNVLVTGLTGFLFAMVLVPNSATLNSPERFDPISIPLLSKIPVIGPVLFQQTIIVYLVYVAVAVAFVALFRTRWGLRVRAVGEHPQAADTVGIKVGRTRLVNVVIAGAIAGLGGAYFTLGSVGAFQKDMTAGMGFIALAAVIFGRWDPVRATLAALLFGFAGSVQYALGAVGSPVPSEFMLMLPYLVTVVAVVGFAGKTSGPAALGEPYASR